MENLEYEFILEATTPIAHHEETLGNSAVLMRRKMRQPDGGLAHVPIITGDTMRHGLREASSYALLEAAGLLGETLSESALRLLFAGGMVTGAGAKVSLDDYRRWVDLIPPLALLGGCAGNRVIGGQLQVDEATLVCSETEHLLSDWARSQVGEVYSPSRSLIEEVQRTRMDPTLQTEKRQLLTGDAQASVARRLKASEGADDDGGKDAAKSSMMPRRHERVIQGALWWWSLTGVVYSDLERDTLLTMLAAFLRSAQVGGKRGTGHGRLHPVAARHVDIGTWEERTEALVLSEGQIGTLFRSHVAERSSDLQDLLSEIQA